ncbi:lipase 3-like [Epargyreus clarus]|uniref:lipase 3-like n=1 Tax=Epargyreus clarus TaxID=520877 RepID=UPI003C2C8673
MSWMVIPILSSLFIFFVETTYVPPSGILKKVEYDFNCTAINKNATELNITPEDSSLNITLLAKKYGYSIEEHKVTTDDGYILSLHRLTKNERLNTTDRMPVFLMHGLLDSSDSWILQGPNTALGYILVDKGYDVWMGNARGNKHSSSHTHLQPDDGRFWKFSWEEIGTHDLPAMIDYALKISNMESLYYIGHSQGTTSFFVMMSLKPEYNTKVKLMFALSPIAWLSHAESPVLKYLSLPSSIFQFFQYINVLSPSTDLLNRIVTNVCKVTSCSNVLETFFGNNCYISDTMLPVILEHSQSTSSVLQFLHFWQLHESGTFRRFDYGWLGNILEYNTFSPPDYDLNGITVPIILFYSDNDWLSHPIDVATLKEHLPNVHKSYHTKYLNHIDYLYAGIAKDAVYMKIIKDIENFELQR